MSSISESIRTKLHTLRHSKGLKGNVLRGGALLGSASFVEQVMRFSRNMLLTRLIAPEAFGAMAIVQSATTLIQVAVDVGVREALVQNPRGEEREYMSAAWWMAIVRSLFIYAVVFACAPFIARFYGNPEFSALARIATLSVLFDGAISTRAYIAMKTMKFRKWAMVNSGGGITGVILTVVLSLFMRDVWALAIGFASENAARCILSYAICPFYPGMPGKAALRDLLMFSKGLFGLSLLNMIFMRADVFVLGKMYSAADLGLYSMAVYLIQTPVIFMVNVMNQSLLPAFSGVQEDDSRLNRILLQVTSATLLFGIPATVFIAFCGRALLTLAYGPRYGAVSTALGIACCAALINVLNIQLTLVFYAKGTPHLHRRSVAVQAIVVVLLIYPFSKIFGLWGAQLACLLAIIAGYLLQVERIRAVTGLRLAQYRRGFAIPIFVSATVAGIWFLVTRYASVLSSPLPNIALGVAGCLLTYFLAGVLRSRLAREAS